MNQTTERSLLFTLAGALAIGFILAASGCSRQVEIKRDTPQAAIASLVKLYSAGDQARVGLIVGPALTRISAREWACAADTVEETRCIRAAIGGSSDPTCLAHMRDARDCPCGERGNAAAAKADEFATSEYNAALKVAHLSPDTCKITNAKELDAKGVGEVSPSFWELACQDVPRTDHFSLVTLACGAASGAALLLQFILHDDGTGWMVAGFAPGTIQALSSKFDSVTSSAAASARSLDLNKDLK